MSLCANSEQSAGLSNALELFWRQLKGQLLVYCFKAQSKTRTMGHNNKGSPVSDKRCGSLRANQLESLMWSQVLGTLSDGPVDCLQDAASRGLLIYRLSLSRKSQAKGIAVHG